MSYTFYTVFYALCSVKNVFLTRSPCFSRWASSPLRLRLAWGSVHEPTAVLVALNCFHDAGATVAESARAHSYILR